MKNKLFFTKIIPVIVLFFISLSIQSQQLIIDSLKTQIENVSNKYEKVILMNELSKFYIKSRAVDSSLAIANEAIELSKKISFIDGEIGGSSQKALALWLLGEDDEGIQLHYQMLKKSEGRDSISTTVFYNIATMYRYGRELDSALKYDFMGLKISEKNKFLSKEIMFNNRLGVDYAIKRYENLALKHFLKSLKGQESAPYDSESYRLLYSNIGQLYVNIDDFEKALEYTKKALEVVNNIGDPASIVKVKTYLGIIYFKLGQYENSKKYLFEAFNDIEKHTIKNFVAIGDLYDYLGQIAIIEDKDYTKAENYFKKGLVEAEKVNNKSNMAFLYNSLSEIYIKKGDIKEAEKYVKLNEVIVENSNQLSTKANLYLVKASLDSLKGNYYGLYLNTTKYEAIEDSLFQTEKINEISQMQVGHETEMKDREIEFLTSENELKDEKQKRMAQLQLTLVGLLGVLIFAIIIFYKRYKEKKRSLVIIEGKNEENRLLMKEMHHRVKNNLQIILSLLNTQTNILKKDDHATAIIQESQNRIKSLALIHEDLYKSTTLSHVDAKIYFENLLNNIENSFQSKRKHIEIIKDIESEELKMSVAVPLGLILNELVTNAFKYAFDNQDNAKIIVKFSVKDGQLFHLDVIDNGVGFPEEFDFKKNTLSFGLQLVDGITSQFDGSFDVKREEGTRFKIMIRDIEKAA